MAVSASEVAREAVGRAPEFRAFRNRHPGSFIVVCGCGVSARQIAGVRADVTIGVNDIGRLFDPTYLVVVNPRSQFTPDRLRFVEQSNARYLFTHLATGRVRPPVVRFRLGRFGGTDLQDGALHYTQNSPYVAVCLAEYLGASRIGLLGVDFTDEHFFGKTGRHALSSRLAEIDAQYGRLAAALAHRGVALVNLSEVSRLTSIPRPVGALSVPAGNGASVAGAGAFVSHPEGSRPRPYRQQTDSSLAPALPSGPLRIAIETHGAGVISQLLDTLAATATSLGHAVYRAPYRGGTAQADLQIVWNGRRHDGRTPALFCEHGWLPRSAYQISPRGINASSHIAPFHWEGQPLAEEARAALEKHFAGIRASVLREEGAYPEQAPGGDFIVVPLQVELDTNIVRHAPPGLKTMQALVDQVSRWAPPWPVVFKQHPSDARRGNGQLRLQVRRPQDEIWPHSRGTIHSLLRSPRCRGVITINSNVAHDALLWDVPVVVLGRNVWPQEGVHKPFLRQVPANWDELQESVRSSTARECRLAYARYLVTNQWTLADARIESRVEALLRSATGQASQARSPAPVAKPTRLAPVVARAEGAASGPIVNVVAEDRGWLFESWKKRFRAVSRSDLEVVVSEKPVGHAAAWIFIRAREARHSPDLSRTVVQIHDSFGPELYRGNGERSHVARCGALCLSHPSQEAVLRSAGISLDRRLWRVQPVGYAPCAQVASEPRREATVAWIGRPGAPGREDPSHTDFFVAAVSRLGRDVQVVLVGERLGELSARLSAMGVSCSVRNTSRYPLERCAQWIREFDCVAITSETDAGPWPLFDALYAGVPVVSRPVGWAKDLLSDGCAGRIVTDPESMGQAIREIVSSRAVRTGPREEALHALQERSIDAWIEANLALARRLIETHEGGGAHTLRADSAVKLDIGCGGKPRAGFTGVDVRPLPGVGVVCNAWELDRHVPPASVSAIYGRHFFEHLTYAQGRAALLAFHKVLRPDGELHLIVPDILYHARQLLHPNPHAPSEHSARWTHREHAIGSLWGWQRGESNELWDVHKAGYDAELLGKTLREAGFTRIRRLPDRPWNLSLTCRRG